MMTALLAGWAAQGAQATMPRSSHVLIVLGEGTESAGTLQTSGSVAGAPADSFEDFSFTTTQQAEVDWTALRGYDTVVLNQVFTASLSEEAKSDLAAFVTSGGKLVIHDADGTEGNDYSWLPAPARTGTSCLNCGHTDGEAEVLVNDELVSSDPASPAYVDLSELPINSDAVGDANVLVTTDPRWQQDIRATNEQNVTGAVDAYAETGGLMIFNGFDTDYLSQGPAYPSGNDWLDKIWYDELAASWNPSSLPKNNPVIGAGGHCGFHELRVGVVTVCAESLSGTPSDTEANGNVVLDEGVSVGNGPLKIDRETGTITAPSPLPIALLRPGAPMGIGNAAFSIDTKAATDPTSGASSLAQVTVTGASFGALGTLNTAGIPFTTSMAGNFTMFLDSASGGGVVVSAQLELPMLGKQVLSGAVSLGLFAGSSAPVEPLGGSVSVPPVQLAPRWKFDGLSLSYQRASGTWTASGGMEAPIGSLSASGSLVGGHLDALQVSLGGADVPLLDSGFFFSGFGGGFKGLVNGPLQIDASTQGFWGVPHAPVEPFYLDNATVTVSMGGSVSLDGAVSFVLRSGSSLHGHLHLQLGLRPFSATGNASIEGSLPGLREKVGGGIGFTAHHFTGSENGELDILSLSGTGQEIISDKGLGASGNLCLYSHHLCQQIAIAGTWSQIAHFDIPSLVGGDPQRLVTVAGVAAAGSAAPIQIPSGRSLLVVTTRAAAGAPRVNLRAPGGAVYSPARHPRSVAFLYQPEFGLTTIAVARPRGGRWRLTAEAGQPGPLTVSAQTTGTIALLRVAGPARPGTARRPLAGSARVRIRWSTAGMHRGVSVTIVTAARPHEEGRGVLGGLPAQGSVSIPVSHLLVGRNYLTLAVARDGVPFQEVRVPAGIWRAPPPRHRRGRHR